MPGLAGIQAAGIAPTHDRSRQRRFTRNLGWFEVAQMRGAIKDGKVQRYQVTLKVGFALE